MAIEAVPYSSVDISFYKTDNFDATAFVDKEDFLDTVTIDLIS